MTFTTLATVASNVGSYLVGGGGLSANNGNYLFVQAAANSTAFTISPSTLTYTANAVSRTYGTANPPLGGTVTGFVNGETQATATTGTMAFTTLATVVSNVGSYLVSGAGLSANNGNYLFVQAAANATALTVTQPTPPLPTPIQVSFSFPTLFILPPSILGSIDLADAFLNPANDLPMLLTAAEVFVGRDLGSVPVEIAQDPRFDGVVACQDADQPVCMITRQQ